MSFLDSIARWLANVFGAPPPAAPAPGQGPEPPLAANAPVVFAAVTVVDAPPGNHEIQDGKLYFVRTADKPKWSLFLCPCGCRSVVTLSLQTVHWPHWRLSKTAVGRPTLYPSVWRDKGCLSHFWIRDGRVTWCFDTGTHPDQRGYS